MHVVDPGLAVLTAAWQAAWADFLANRVGIAERRAAPFLHALPEKLAVRLEAADDDHADSLMMLADLSHLAGAVRGEEALLRLALTAYDTHLGLNPSNFAAMRMRAETMLRLRDYAGAFAAFNTLYAASLADATGEVAPFQLIHDAECIEDAVRLGADAVALDHAASWRALADELCHGAGGDATARIAVKELSPSQRALLGAHGTPLPLPPTSADARSANALGSPPAPPALLSLIAPRALSLAPPPMQAPVAPAPLPRALRADIDWAWATREYAEQRTVVIDDLLSPTALRAIQSYARHGAHFRTLRKGYLGAFPSDGTVHPLLLALAEELTAAAPALFGAHTLALWWIFKYDETNHSGIGIHADPAAVNINLWLTDDVACEEGGGLAIYSYVPPLALSTPKVNHEFESEAAEQALRAQLVAAGRVRTIGYRCNRAAIFVSDQYHESLPFRFRPGYEHRRANLTLLFGDRWSSALHPQQQSMQQSASSGCGRAEAVEERAAGGGGGSVPQAAAESSFDVFDG